MRNRLPGCSGNATWPLCSESWTRAINYPSPGSRCGSPLPCLFSFLRVTLLVCPTGLLSESPHYGDGIGSDKEVCIAYDITAWAFLLETRARDQGSGALTVACGTCSVEWVR